MALSDVGAGLKQVESSERADDCVSDRNNPSYTSETNPCKSAPLMLSTPESIHNSAQQLVESLNNKRKQDAEIISQFKKALEMHVCMLDVILIVRVNQAKKVFPSE